jgi:hypothetical protein
MWRVCRKRSWERVGRGVGMEGYRGWGEREKWGWNREVEKREERDGGTGGMGREERSGLKRK